MLQPRCSVNLSTKAISVYRRSHIGRKNLDDDLSVELELRGNEHARHPSAPQLAIDAISRAQDFLDLGS
jgi:hypothetical protein